MIDRIDHIVHELPRRRGDALVRACVTRVSSARPLPSGAEGASSELRSSSGDKNSTCGPTGTPAGYGQGSYAPGSPRFAFITEGSHQTGDDPPEQPGRVAITLGPDATAPARSAASDLLARSRWRDRSDGNLV